MGYRLCEAEFTRNLHVKLRCFWVVTWLKLNMFTVGVVMLSYLAGKALICREMFCEWVPFCLLSMSTGACSQHMRV